MPIGEGWFIALHTGEFIRIFEHATDVVDAPERYGLTRETLAGLSGLCPAHRERILRLVMEQGFMRVRGHRGHWVFEHAWPARSEVVAAIARFAAANGLGEFAEIEVHHVNRPEEALLVRLRDLGDHAGPPQTP